MSVTTTAATCCRPLADAQLGDAEVEATAALFKALGEPARVRLLNIVATSGEPVCACHLTEPTGLSQPTVSHHLKKLVQAGLLRREQRGIWAYFSINPDAVERLASIVDLKGAER